MRRAANKEIIKRIVMKKVSATSIAIGVNFWGNQKVYVCSKK